MINKKTSFFFLFFLLGFVFSIAQNPEINHQKYWYYRYRLINNFMIVGEGQGKSLPATIRGRSPQNTLKWGDETIQLGYYIGILATEYKLLNDRGLDTKETLRELFYALEAFNRLDMTAESYWRSNNIILTEYDLNGFFIRGDAPANFVANNNSHFNSGKVPSHISASETDSRLQFGERPLEETHDQIEYFLVGCALIRRCIGDEVVYATEDVNGNQIIHEFMDHETRILIEMQNIVRRIFSWMNRDPEHYWLIKNPITGCCIEGSSAEGCPPSQCNCIADGLCGGDMSALAYGGAEAACYCVGEYSEALHDLPPPPHTPLLSCNIHNSLSIANFEVWQILAHTPFQTYNGEDIKTQTLAAIGNSWYQQNPLLPGTSINSTSLVLRQRYDEASNTNSCALETSPPVCNYIYEHLSLLRQVLHGGSNLIESSRYEYLLNVAPCIGPNNRFTNNASTGWQTIWERDVADGYSYEWSATNRLNNPHQRGIENGDFSGEFPGLDYMLYFNMYALAQEDYLDNVGYFSMMDNNWQPWLEFNTTYNGNFPHGNDGTHANPYTLEAFSTINESNIIQSAANVTYHAGEEITLTDGFMIEEGAEFLAYVSPFTCIDYDYNKTDEVNNETAPDNTEQEPINELKIIPNPNNGMFDVFTGNRVASSIVIYDITGRQVFSTSNVISTSTHIDLSYEQAGVYLLMARYADGSTERGRLVKD